MDEDNKDNKKQVEEETDQVVQEEDEKVTEESKEDGDREGYEKMIEDLKSQLDAEKNAKLRALADYQNLRNRHTRELDELRSFSQTVTLLKVMDVIDDFRNLLEVIEGKELDEGVRNGIQMIYSKLMDVVLSEGVEVIPVEVNDMFSPEIHEAVGSINVNEEEMDNKIAKVVSLGYRQRDGGKIIRTVRVIVNKKNT